MRWRACGRSGGVRESREGEKKHTRGADGEGGGGKREQSGNEERGEGRATPYLRNFKLNCDVFKLTFLPEPFFLSVPAALRRENGARRGRESEREKSCDITADFFPLPPSPCRWAAGAEARVI